MGRCEAVNVVAAMLTGLCAQRNETLKVVHLVSNLRLAHNFLEVFKHVIVDVLLILCQHNHSSVLEVVVHDFRKLREVPTVPFPHPHDEGVDILI